MRIPTHLTTAAGIAFAAALLAAPTHAQQEVKTDIPDSLATHASVTESAARATVMHRIPKGQIRAVELERERGHLQYSYDVDVPGRSGITEVNVDARSGAILGVHHESAAQEAKESADKKKSGP